MNDKGRSNSQASSANNVNVTDSEQVPLLNTASSSSRGAMPQLPRDASAGTRIDIEPSHSDIASERTPAATTPNTNRNISLLFNEARSLLMRHSSLPNATAQQQHREEQILPATNRGGAEQVEAQLLSGSPSSANPRPGNMPNWRLNLNNVLSFSTAPSPEALRSLITNTGNFRYSPISTNAIPLAENASYALTTREQVFPARNDRDTARYETSPMNIVSTNRSYARSISSPYVQQQQAHRQSENLDEILVASSPSSSSNNSNAALPVPELPHRDNNAADGLPTEDEESAVTEMLVQGLSLFARYLPFLCIIFAKFLYDHLLAIVDLLLLQTVMFNTNKSLREQVAKLSQKNYSILVRDICLLIFVVIYRIILAGTAPDPWGMLLPPPMEEITLVLHKAGGTGLEDKQQLMTPPLSNNNIIPFTENDNLLAQNSTVAVTKVISLGTLIYYMAVNDLLLRLLTIIFKISLTAMPIRMIKRKARARTYVVIEHVSQLYRAVVPVRQWLFYLFASYTGLEMISGVLFSCLYMGAKGFDIMERCRSLKKSVLNLVRNTDYERSPTKEELDAAGSVCPICHDGFNSPVILSCGHLFCDECVNTWFKREQTCPMCRAKVSEDPAWQDGSTTFYFQLF